VQLLRLQRASMQLVLEPVRSITDIGFAAGLMNGESFRRAFRKAHGMRPGLDNTYGIHYTDPDTSAPEDYRLDIALLVSART
jgi:DNA gyrase inhibitor GyrI